MSLPRAAKRSARRAASAAVRATTSPAAMRSRAVAGLWGAAVTAPGLSDRSRGRLADLLHTRLLAAGQPERAARVSAAALRRVASPKLRAEILARQAVAELDAGTPPSLPAAVAAQLALADARLGRGDVAGAVGFVEAAQRQLFDRRLHFDRLTSPLADDARGFLAPWHASAAVRALSAPRGRRGEPAPPPTDRPLRLLMVTYGNHGFLDLIRRHFDERPDVELRFLDPGEDGTHVPLLNNRRAMAQQILAGDTTYGDKVTEWLAPQVEWADVVFVDWCAALAVLFSLLDPGSTRVIVRLHSFEAFAVWPHLVDFSRVDDLIFVSDHLRDLTVAAVPAVTAAGTRLHVISNAMDLRAFGRPKDDEARFTLGLVGIKAVAKDPRWAVEVLRHLRAHDERYRLLLFGRDLDADASPDSRRYWDGFLADIAELEPAGAVVRVGQVDDVPAALSRVGVILSSSVRESFHCGLVEGAASGAVPVVRDWPFFAGRPASARSLFPADWVVDGPAEAAERILAVTATEDSWRKAGESAAEHAVATWDWPPVERQFDQLVTDRTVRTSGGN
ncbi:glycosyltransferase [Micromonospora sp. WMMD1128]|uniref:glycosyltransferase n=1 Tax=Micromonospora sp. WMMD1128 TaxID=3015150 RepID=UPI00248C0BF8|nr:glycosyltransferase [Micromonospora sp. WMMD1128]WBB71770.1 glycosyltransferase [Micromonospora sp. WMMD1128]